MTEREAFSFAPAKRESVRLKLGISGPSGSGKTLGALALASALAPSGKIALIDTENGSASLYADRFTFDTLTLKPPYSSERYLQALAAAVRAGYDVAVIDSISHQWAGEGGILPRKEDADTRPGANSYINWGIFTKEHERFKAKLLNAPIHTIATLRSKQDYVLVKNEQGKQTPQKVGMAPIQRDGFEYEFSIVFELQMDHKAQVSKDRTGIFDGRVVDLTDIDVAKELIEWMAKGATPAAPTLPAAPDGFPFGAPVSGKEKVHNG